MGAQAERIFPIFIGVWFALCIFSGVFFFLNNNAALKRKAWPPFVMGTGVLFLVFMGLMEFPAELLVVMAVGIALTTFLNLRIVKFCDVCGKTLMQNFVAPPKFCSRCGAALQSRDK